MTPSLGAELEALVAGELAPAAAERVLAVLATSDAAAAQLEACLQLRAIGHALRAAGGHARDAEQVAVRADTKQVADLAQARAARRRRHRWLVLAAPLAAAAAAALFVMVRRAPSAGGLDAQLIAALSPHRRLEPRLSWPGADQHRPYDPSRAAIQRPEALPVELLAGLERTHDARAAAAAALLTGNAAIAAAELARAPETPDVLSDRAAVALVQGDPDLAVIATAGALARAPGHPQALWNRALALHALGLDRSAAAAFDALAARGEPGWCEEARGQAAMLHAWRARHDAAWHDVATRAAAMALGGPPPIDQVAAFSSALRGYFYDAVRMAPSADRVRALAPLADALDTAVGGDVLRRHVDRIAGAPFARRAALAARCRALARGELDAAHRAALIGDLRAAHQDDQLLGVLAPGARDPAPADGEEYARLAQATGDPWFELAAAEQGGAAAIRRGDLAAAEVALHDAGDRCEHSGLAYRCIAIWRRLTEVYGTAGRAADAGDALAHAMRAALAAGAVPLEDDLLRRARALAAHRRDASALATAYRDELGAEP